MSDEIIFFDFACFFLFFVFVRRVVLEQARCTTVRVLLMHDDVVDRNSPAVCRFEKQKNNEKNGSDRFSAQANGAMMGRF